MRVFAVLLVISPPILYLGDDVKPVLLQLIVPLELFLMLLRQLDDREAFELVFVFASAYPHLVPLILDLFLVFIHCRPKLFVLRPIAGTHHRLQHVLYVLRS